MNERNHSPLLGFLFLAYAFGTLSLALSLAHWPHPNPALGDMGDQSVALIKTGLESKKAKRTDRPDFAEISHILARKQAFFDYLLPAIAEQNILYTEIRLELLAIQKKLQNNQNLSAHEQSLQFSLAQQGREDHTSDDQTLNTRLLKKVDVIPASMVLAQGAMESAWGTSRFARKANNYFGQWCFSRGCGLVPQQRNDGAIHEVASFKSIDGAVAAYFLNINRHPAYAKVRNIRAKARRKGQQPNGLDMVEGLEKYSARGHAYIEELQSMIRYNKISNYD